MNRTSTRKKTRDAVQILEHMVGQDEPLRQLIAREQLNAEVAKLIYRSRMKAKLTQAQLATLIGTKQPVIARLEDADYKGHSLLMLQKIAATLGQRIEIRFAPARKPAHAA